MPDRIAEHYERHAHAFDEARRRNFVEQHWLDRFLLAVPKGGHILDLGCGGGEPIDRYLIDTGHQLTGVDVSERMISLARTRFGRHTWLRADMRRAAMGRKFHGVLAWDSLFHLAHQDQADMLYKIGGWLEHGGALLFNSGPTRGEVVGEQFGDPLYHASLEPYEYRELFRLFGLTEVAHAPDDQATGGRTVWLARKTG
ncbi:methyltransferase domain-containing protein [Sphingomonas sp. LB-2]|uniref:class I SAM-dependent DNA methyltransferase n=1 Tax=Sphingomonas caeni TaxID=2984949 RepID=UPI00222E0919|nr:class I SAM-dependent methyltransferase [Sphingomonas caeni]MCW3845739.1 methyltransferase domain-containing protein [Sphingomonas caeni]